MSSGAIPDFQALLDAVIAASPNPGSPVHGEHHWQSVALIGARLCEQVPEADPAIVLLFSIFHDAMRNSDGQDRDHGRRGAELVRKLNGSLYHLTRDHLALLEEACAHHSEGRVATSPTKGVCWDADRLNLLRVGFSPDPWLLSTDAARREDNIAWAPWVGQERHAWPQIWSRYVGQLGEVGMLGKPARPEVPIAQPDTANRSRPRLYHLDAGGALKPGLVLERRHLSRSPLQRWQSVLRGLVPNELTPHGESRLLAPLGLLDAEATRWAVLELCFELVRRERFQQAPSRLSVLFATDSLELLLAGLASPFAQDLPGQVIYELEAADAFRCDMAWTWLHSGPVAEILQNACRYWAGEPKQYDEPYWEDLLTPPVRVLRRVDAASKVAYG